MRIAVFCSGTKSKGPSTIIKAQVNSLTSKGINIDIHTIEKGGIVGYLNSIVKFRKILKAEPYDLIHAHFSFSGIVASLAGGNTVITSLMGSDVNKNKFYKFTAKIFVHYFWDHTIVKSSDMATHFSEDKVTVIPNGVDISMFTPINRAQACNALGWDSSNIHILFAANPFRSEKNFQLAEEAYELVSKQHSNIELHVLNNVTHVDMPNYMHASDVVLLTSKWEGSPNVIKEAMACNRPIVCTDVGDVFWLFGDEPGHFLTSPIASEVANNLEKALEFSQNYDRTEGRGRIKTLGLDSEKIAERILDLYKETTT